MKIRQKAADKVWTDFTEDEKITEEQLKQFEKYADFLMQRNEEFNLTAIRELSGVVRQHFQDSISLHKFMDLTKITTICDIGTGAGFPAIPLKIMFPHLHVILIEVTKKKLIFLEELIDLLQLDNVELCELDWRTFIRTTEGDINLFVTRAALDDLELTRSLKPACFYSKTPIVYWVSEEWEPNPKISHLVKRIETYKLAKKTRRLAFIANDLTI